MAWAKTTVGSYLQRTPIVLPPDHWAQVTVWVPAGNLTACDDGDLFGDSAYFLLAADGIFLSDRNYPNGNWKLETDYGVDAGPMSTGASHTVKYHRHSDNSVDWYLDGTHVASRLNISDFSQLYLGFGAEGCACESYFFTDVRVGTSDGGTDIFADDFSGGLGNWIVKSFGGAGAAGAAVVSAPSEGCPRITLSPAQGPAGTVVHVTGTGFAANSPLSFTFGQLTVDMVFSEATTDAGGNVNGTFVVPHVFAGSDDVYLADSAANVAVAGFNVCSTKTADAISTLPDPIVASGGEPVPATGTFNSGTPLAYIRHAGAHWIAWQDGSTTGYASYSGSPDFNYTAFGSIFPPPPNRTLMLTRVADDGTQTDYEIDTGYQWNFGGGDVNALLGDWWTKKFFFESWSKPIIDIKLASDGETLWVAILTAETVIYPYISTDDGDSPDHPSSIAQFVDLATLTSNFTSFATNRDSGYLRYYNDTTGFAGLFYDANYPVSDNGEQASGHWSPPRLVVFAGGDGGFSRIGHVDTKYVGGDTDGVGNATSTHPFGGPAITQTADQVGKVLSGLSIAASDAEPGVCHVVFSEGGAWGQYGQGVGNGVDPLTWDGGPENLSYRVSYSTWDAGSKTGDHDLWDAHIDRSQSFFYYAIQNGLGDWNTLRVGYSWPDQEHMRATGMHALRNEHGSPVLFLTWPRVVQNAPNIDSIANFGGSNGQPPDNVDRPWLDNALVQGEPTVHMYDISGGTPTLLQEITPDLLPTEEEMEFFNPLNPARGVVAPETPTALNGGYTGYSGLGGSEHAGGFTDRAFMLSTLYHDPLLGGQPVYLLGVPWTRAFDTLVTGSNYPVRCFYRVPVDGSGPFEFLDGDRQVKFTIVNEAPSSGHALFGSEDFYSDAKSIWCPNTTYAYSGFFGSAYGVQYDRICRNDWLPYSLVPDDSYLNHLDRLSYVPSGAVRGFFWNQDTDTLSYAGYGPFYDDTGSNLTPPYLTYSIFTLEFCRGCVACQCQATGLHAFLRFGHNR